MGKGKDWVGFDLDKTTAYFDRWRGATHIGRPIPKIIRRIQRYLENGTQVKIFTARMADPDPTVTAAVERAIAQWTEEHVGIPLEATCVKDRDMIRCYDDKAVQVLENRGLIVSLKGDK